MSCQITDTVDKSFLWLSWAYLLYLYVNLTKGLVTAILYKHYGNCMLILTKALPSGDTSLMNGEMKLYHSYVILAKLIISLHTSGTFL